MIDYIEAQKTVDAAIRCEAAFQRLNETLRRLGRTTEELGEAIEKSGPKEIGGESANAS